MRSVANSSFKLVELLSAVHHFASLSVIYEVKMKFRAHIIGYKQIGFTLLRLMQTFNVQSFEHLNYVAKMPLH